MKSLPLLFNNSTGDSHDGHTGRQNIFDHHGAGPDPHVVRDPDAAEDLGVLSDVHVVADDGGVVGVAAVTADAAVAVDDATLADTRFRIHDDGSEMLQMQVFSKAAGTDDEAQPGAEAVLAPTIPEAKQFVRRGKGVFLLLTKKTQVPLDVVHLGADPPFEESFF